MIITISDHQIMFNELVVKVKPRTYLFKDTFVSYSANIWNGIPKTNMNVEFP